LAYNFFWYKNMNKNYSQLLNKTTIIPPRTLPSHHHARHINFLVLVLLSVTFLRIITGGGDRIRSVFFWGGGGMEDRLNSGWSEAIFYSIHFNILEQRASVCVNSTLLACVNLKDFYLIRIKTLDFSF
jgi:hypothetical protein